MKTMIGALALATACLSAPAFAATSPTLGGSCTTDLSLTGNSTLLNCYGRVSGNALNNANNTTINTALTALGYGGPAISYNQVPAANILSLGTSANTTVNFPGLLYGIAYIGIHTGNANNGLGNQTSFYKISASNLDSFTLIAPGGSTATLFATVAAVSPVPEPATWALLLVGFAMVGATARYRRRSLSVAHG